MWDRDTCYIDALENLRHFLCEWNYVLWGLLVAYVSALCTTILSSCVIMLTINAMYTVKIFNKTTLGRCVIIICVHWFFLVLINSMGIFYQTGLFMSSFKDFSSFSTTLNFWGMFQNETGKMFFLLKGGVSWPCPW